MSNQYVASLPRSQLQRIVSAMVYAAEAHTPEQVLRRIAHASRELVEAKYAALGIPNDHGEGFRFFEASGITAEVRSHIPHPPIGKGLLATIIEKRQPLLIHDISQDPRTAGFPEGHPHMKTLLGVPIQAGSQLLGILYLADREDGQPFDNDDLWLAETQLWTLYHSSTGTTNLEEKR